MTLPAIVNWLGNEKKKKNITTVRVLRNRLHINASALYNEGTPYF